MEIIDRIETLLAEGKLKERPQDAPQGVKTFADMLEPYSNFYDGQQDKDWTNSINVNRPKFKRSFRANSIPLPFPFKSTAPTQVLALGMFDTVRGIWEYYLRIGVNEPWMLELPVNEMNFVKLSQKMFEVCGDYYPMVMEWENDEEGLLDRDGLNLWLPSNDGNADEAGIVEAFFTGHEELAGMMMHLDSLSDVNGEHLPLDLSCFDRHLVDTVGYKDLMEFYYHYNGDKHVDQRKLVDCYQNYFYQLGMKYPHADEWLQRIDIIIYDQHPMVYIRCGEDIAFAIDYAEAFETMMNSIPRAWAMEQREDNESEDFIQNVCAVWRKGHL